MNNWRPVDWSNPHSCLGRRTNNHRKYDAYEAGADAMLLAIRKLLSTDINQYTFTTTGTLVDYNNTFIEYF